MSQKPPAAAVADLAPNGTLRAAINVGNVVGRKSAYDLYLTRSLKQAELVRTPTSAAVVDVFMKENYEVEFVEDIKRSGFVAQALARHHQTATVAPPGP